jgi:RNA polymerase sigma-70 factor (ECF subfamily)
MDEKEKKLIEGLKAGRDSAYEELFRVHYPILKELALHMVRDEFVAKTIVSDFFFHIWEIRTELCIGSSLRGYLARGVYNRCLNHLRSAQSGLGKSQPLSPETDLAADETPLGRLMAKELEQEMEEAIASLPDATKKVFLMHRSDGLKYEEIAKETGISVNTVKYHIKRALAFLRQRFGKDGPPLP